MAEREPIKVDLQADGVLWLINRVVFHPRGFALAVKPATGEFSMLGDGSEVWTFNDADDEKFAAVEAMLDRAREGHYHDFKSEA